MSCREHQEHQAAPPAPTGEVRGEGVTVVVIEHHHSWCKPGENGEMNPHQVSIVTRPEMTVFVRTFGGFAKDKDWREQKDKLLASLEDHPDYARINTDEFYW